MSPGDIARLASEHLLKPSTLLHRGLEWWDTGKPEKVGAWSRRTTHLRLRAQVNGHHSAERWTELLERLSGVQNLKDATINSWSHLFPQRHLIKAHHSWCPECYTEENGGYDRLLWCLAPVEVCPVHKCTLSTLCPDCHSLVPSLHAHSCPGICPKCRASLACHEHANLRNIQATGFQLWAANAMASFLTEVNSGSFGITKRCPAGSVIKRCMGLLQIEGLDALARYLDVAKTTAWSWYSDQVVPDLPNTLRICYIFGLSLSEALTGDFAFVAAAPSTGPTPRVKRPTPRKIDDNALRSEIATLVAHYPNEALSLCRVAHHIGISPRVLRKHFPELCRHIARDHKRYTKERAMARQAKVKDEIRAAVEAEAREEASFTVKSVGRRLKQPGTFRNPVARGALEQLLLQPF